MPGFRFPVSIPKSLGELFERIRELLPQLEAKVLPNRLIGTTETKIAHGLKSTPVFVVPSHPHCIAIVKETRRADHEFIYLKATNLCVVNVWTLAVGQLGRSLVPDGGYKLPDWDPEGLDDHEVKADSTDTGHGPLKDKLKDSATLTWQLDTTGGVHTVKGNVQGIPAADDHLVKARTADATTVGGLMEKTGPSDTITPELYTDPSTGIERVRFNTTPVTPPAGEGSWLYTGSIQASNLKDPVKAFIKSLEGMGGLDPGQSELFTVLENGDFEHKAVGQLYGLAPDGTETFAVSVGQRVWLTMWLGAADSTYHGGFCTVQTLGDGSTKAVLRPAGESVAVGDMFTVEGVGAEYYGWYWEILSLPEKTLAYRPEYVNATTYNLFTNTNVQRAGTATRETSVTIPGGTSGGTMFEIPCFEMLDVLGVSTIPKGVINWKIKAYVVADDPAATVFVRAFLTTDQGILDRFGYGDTPPMHNTSAVVLECQGTIAEDRTVDPSAKLGAVFYGYSNSASAVTIKLVFNDAGHGTRVQTPLTTASFGTLDHGLLTPISRKFPNTAQGTADAVLYAHPRVGIQDVVAVPASLSGGNMTPDPTADTTKIASTATIDRIDSSRWPGGFCRSHRLIFCDGGTLTNQAGTSGDFVSLDLGNFEGLSESQAATLEFYANGIADLMLINGGWRLASFYTGRKPT